MSRSALTSKSPGERTMMFLRQFDLVDTWEKDPLTALNRLLETFYKQPGRETLFVLMELCYIEAQKASKFSDDAAKFYLSSLVYAYNYLFDDDLGPAPSSYHPYTRLACAFYNRSLSAVIVYSRHKNIRFKKDMRFPLVAGQIQFSSRHSELKFRSEEFDQFYVAYEYEVEGLTNLHGAFGIGVPMILLRASPKVENQRKGDQYLPKIRQTYGASAFLRLRSFMSSMKEADAVVSAQVELYDPKNKSHIRIGDHLVPLESDFTTPLAYMVGHSEPPKGIKGLFRVEAWTDRQGLYMLQPYETGKIPVVFVHGLMSSPMTWLQMLNNLMGDEEIREHYQFWFFMYPTGNPILYSAANLRDSLNTIHKVYDPDGGVPAMSQMVLVGHSMGGILSRLMVQKSSDTIWLAFSNVPVRDLNLSPEQQRLVEKVVFFEPLPFVTRAIFISAPHRGSDWADRQIGKLGSSLVKLPVNLLTSTAEVLIDAGQPTDQTKLFINNIDNIPTGIDALSPNNPLNKIAVNLPIAPPLT